MYATLVRKLINWLTVKTGEGDLFEIDTALRPNGNSGLLVTSFEAYAKYQQQRGSNTAWTWEHQAMTRARYLTPTLVTTRTALHLAGRRLPEASLLEPVQTCSSKFGAADSSPVGVNFPRGGPSENCVSVSMRQRFEQIREGVVTAPRDAKLLRDEIVTMRKKVSAAHPVKNHMFDVKHSAGGMVDAEFAVQYLVLSQSAHYPQLMPNSGNIALLQAAESVGLLPAGVGQKAASAYRELRRVQHRARLNEEPTQVVPPALQAEREAIEKLWTAVFESAE